MCAFNRWTWKGWGRNPVKFTFPTLSIYHRPYKDCSCYSTVCLSSWGSTESKTCSVSRMVAFYHYQWNLATLLEPWVILSLGISLRMRSILMWFGPSSYVWNSPKKLSRLATPALWRFAHHLSCPRLLAPGQRQKQWKSMVDDPSEVYRASAHR